MKIRTALLASALVSLALPVLAEECATGPVAHSCAIAGKARVTAPSALASNALRIFKIFPPAGCCCRGVPRAPGYPSPRTGRPMLRSQPTR